MATAAPASVRPHIGQAQHGYMTDTDLSMELRWRKAARERLFYFCMYLNPNFQPRPYQMLIASAMEMVERREITRLMVLLPAQFGKSEVTSRNFPAWYLGKHPDHALILCSYADDLAFNFTFEARGRVMDPRYANIFGSKSGVANDLPIEISQQRKAIKEWRLANHRGRMKAAGTGAGISGYPADLILIDDPLKDYSDVATRALQEKLMRWYTGQLYGRLSPIGAIVLVNTRWSDRDLSGMLLKGQQESGEYWHVLRLPALAETPRQTREWCERNHVARDHYIEREWFSNLDAPAKSKGKAA